MNMKKYTIDVVVAYVVFAILWTVVMMAMPTLMDPLKDIMHPMDHPNQTMILIFHLIQTMVMVWFWHKGIGSNNVSAGAVFGAMYGVLVASTDLIWWYGLNASQEPMGTMTLGHIVISAIVGIVLAKMHK